MKSIRLRRTADQRRFDAASAQNEQIKIAKDRLPGGARDQRESYQRDHALNGIRSPNGVSLQLQKAKYGSLGIVRRSRDTANEVFGVNRRRADVLVEELAGTLDTAASQMQRIRSDRTGVDTLGRGPIDHALRAIDWVWAKANELRPEWMQMATAAQRASLETSLGRYNEALEANHEFLAAHLQQRAEAARGVVYDSPIAQGAHERRIASAHAFASGLRDGGQRIRDLLDSASSTEAL